MTIACLACKMESHQRAGDEHGRQVEGLRREVNQYSLQLAHRHEERDKALVELSRLEEVASLVRKEQGVNRRTVSPKS